MTFWPKGQPDKKFNFDATPDTGASVSMIAENVAKKNKLEVNKQKKLKIKAANGATMECSGGITTTGQHRVTKTSTDIEMKVSKVLKDEILAVSYTHLTLPTIYPV